VTAREPLGSPQDRRSDITVAPSPKRHPYDQWAPDARALDLVGDKWTLLIVRDLLAGPRRFVELQRVLPGISTEQLRSRLHRMVADGLLTRHRYREVPPRVDYALTDRARALEPVIGELARWGYDWAWGAPRDGEAVDVGAVFRCALGLLAHRANVAGTLQMSVGERFYTLHIAASGATLSEKAADAADATVAGDRDAWVEALGPHRDREGLVVTGDARLVAAVLDGISAAGAAVPRLAGALGA
jgi:DNA-binding HxlR family transcriptional regulator